MLEKMADFFENRLDGYDEHMMTSIEAADEFYPFTAKQLLTAENCNTLDLGCGTGLELEEYYLLNPSAKVTALDYSELSVEKTKDYNKDMIASGRCKVVQGNVAQLPFSDGEFELATAFETVYFWPGLEHCFAEVCRVLKKGGTFLICNESDGTDKTSLKFEKIIEGMKCYTVEQLEKALRTAGFTEVNAVHHPKKPWITVIAKK